MQTIARNQFKEVLSDFIGFLDTRCREQGITIDKKRIMGRIEHDWKQFEEQVMACDACLLSAKRLKAVPGSGNHHARLMVVGEAPGAREDERGLPFVGPAGELLTKILASIQLGRDQVYITNVVKCRPPANREPFPEEIAACNKYLRWQIAHLKPEIILALGNYAIKTLTQTTSGVTRIHGNLFTYEGVTVMASFHPSALLRNEELKRPMWEDMKKLKKFLMNGRF